MGMMLMSAYGDALGAPRELQGLQGRTASVPSTRALRRFGDFSRDDLGQAWGLWPSSIPPEQRGVVTDDTAYAMSFLYPWVCERAPGSALSEQNHRAWMHEAKTAPQQVRAVYTDQRTAWRAIWADHDDWSHGHMTPPREENRFYRPRRRFSAAGRPVILGLFLYLPLGFTAPLSTSVTEGLSVCSLHEDRSAAEAITALAFSLLSRAAIAPGDAPFGAWLSANLGMLLAIDAVEPARTATERGAAIGVSLKRAGVDPDDAVARIKRALYDPAEANADPEGLWKFSPSLCWSMMMAAAFYANEDPALALSMLAAGAGDCDTMPALWGALCGAYLGYRRLEPREELQHVRGFVERNFACKLEPFARALAAHRTARGP